MDRGNSRSGSVPIMSTQPIGQSVIDMTSVCLQTPSLYCGILFHGKKNIIACMNLYLFLEETATSKQSLTNQQHVVYGSRRAKWREVFSSRPPNPG